MVGHLVDDLALAIDENQGVAAVTQAVLSRSELLESPFYEVITTNKAERVVVAPRAVWVSVARTMDAFRREYLESGCLNRELADVSAHMWKEMLDSNIVGGNLTVKLPGVAPIEYQATPEMPAEAGGDLVRLRFDWRPEEAV